MRKLGPKCASAGQAPTSSATSRANTKTATRSAKLRVRRRNSQSAAALRRNRWPSSAGMVSCCNDLLQHSGQALARCRIPERLAVRLPQGICPTLLHDLVNRLRNRHIVQLNRLLGALTISPVEELQRG